MRRNDRLTAPFKLGGFLSGILIGGLAGTTVALLTAPQSGKKTRALIRRQGVELRDQAAEAMDEARQQTERAVRQARQSERRVSRRIEAAAEAWRRRSEAVVSGRKDRVQSALEALHLAGRDARS